MLFIVAYGCWSARKIFGNHYYPFIVVYLHECLIGVSYLIFCVQERIISRWSDHGLLL